MRLDDVVARVDDGLIRLGRFFNREDFATEWGEEARRLSESLQERQVYLADCRRRVESLLGRITDQRDRSAALTEQVRQHMRNGDQRGAWETALELERLNQALDADRRELARLQSACLGCQAQIVRLERDLAAVQLRLFPD